MSSGRVEGSEWAGTDGAIRFGYVEEPRVSIIVTGWRSAPHLVECLASLKAQVHSIPFEVVASLNEPAPALLDSLERDVVGVRILSTSVNVGFGGACNRGASEARGELLVLLNDDAVVLDGWLEALVDAADQHDQAGAVGSRILLEDGTIQEEGAVIWADGATTLLGYQSAAASSQDLRLRRVDYCSAASLLVKRATWESTGGMDTAYFPAYYEDVDLCLKIEAQGQKIMYQPRSMVIHREGSSTTTLYKLFLAQRNKQRLAARWAPALALHEPRQDSPEAVARAVRSGETRPLPIPGPLPLSGDEAEEPPATDGDYLRRQLDVLSSYITTLEGQVTSGEEERSHLRTNITELEHELHRMHLAAAELQANGRRLEEHLIALRTEAEATQVALSVLKGRRRYVMVDRAYDVALAVPGFQRALEWAGSRRRPTAPPKDAG